MMSTTQGEQEHPAAGGGEEGEHHHVADVQKFVPYVKRAKETLGLLTQPKKMGEGEEPDPMVSEMNVVELFNCQGLAFLSCTKAGFIVSGMHGTGFVIRRVSGGSRSRAANGFGGPRMAKWSAPVPISTTSGSFGFTAGYGQTDSVIVLDTEKAVDAFKHTQVSLGNDFTIRAGRKKEVPLGGDGGGHVDLAKFRDLGATWDSFGYTLAKGAILDLSFSGDGMSVNKRLMKEMYGEGVTPDAVLNGADEGDSSTSSIKPPECMNEFYDELETIMATYYRAYKAKRGSRERAEAALAPPTPAVVPHEDDDEAPVPQEPEKTAAEEEAQPATAKEEDAPPPPATTDVAAVPPETTPPAPAAPAAEGASEAAPPAPSATTDATTSTAA